MVGEMPDPTPLAGGFAFASPSPASTRLNAALEAGWPGFDIAEQIPLQEIARAHEQMEHSVGRGWVVVTL